MYQEKQFRLTFVVGLLSDGGVHSHNSHLYGLLEMAKKNGLENVYVHAFLDGRDTPPASGKDYVQQLEDENEGNRSRKDCFIIRPLLCNG